jgi:hypothetical protein
MRVERAEIKGEACAGARGPSKRIDFGWAESGRGLLRRHLLNCGPCKGTDRVWLLALVADMRGFGLGPAKYEWIWFGLGRRRRGAKNAGG